MNRDSVLIDTGPLVAIFSAQDSAHELCLQQLQTIQGPLLTCLPVISEAAWLLRRYPDAIDTVLRSFNNKPLQLMELTEADLPSIADIVKKYRNLGLQVADASLLHLANREQIDVIFTLDRRDFSVVRRMGGKRLRIIP